jgi:hypothetical protein
MGCVRLACLVLVLAGCSADAQPPPITDPDGGPIEKADVSVTPPCSTPAPGCACAEAGAQFYCGIIYREVGMYVSCSPGYLTCQDDGGWSRCEGPSVFDGN